MEILEHSVAPDPEAADLMDEGAQAASLQTSADAGWQPALPLWRRTRAAAMIALMASLFLAVGLSACDKKSEPHGKKATSEKPAPATDETPQGKFTLTKFEVSGSQDVYQNEEAPTPEQVEEKLEAALYALDTFERDGSRKLEGRVTYDVRPLPAGEGWDVMLLGGLTSPQAVFEAGANHRSDDSEWEGKSIDEMVDGAVAEFADKIAAQSRVLGSDVDGVIAILRKADESESALLMAIQEIRERNATAGIDAVRPYLSSEHPSEFRTAAAATLVKLGDEESRSAILKVAEDLSRDQDPQYVPMLHILADLGGTEILTYLEAVAEGHSAPAVRAVAQEALTSAREKRRPAPAP